MNKLHYAFKTTITLNDGTTTTRTTRLDDIAGVELVGIENETYQAWNVAAEQGPYADYSKIASRQAAPREMTLRFEVGADGLSHRQGYQNLLDALVSGAVFADEADRISVCLVKLERSELGVLAETRSIDGTVREFSEPRYKKNEETFATLVFASEGLWKGNKDTKVVYKQSAPFSGGFFVMENKGAIIAPFDIELKYTPTVSHGDYNVTIFSTLGAYTVHVSAFSPHVHTLNVQTEKGYAVSLTVPDDPDYPVVTASIADVSGKLFKLIPGSNDIGVVFTNTDGTNIDADVSDVTLRASYTPLCI